MSTRAAIKQKLSKKRGKLSTSSKENSVEYLPFESTLCYASGRQLVQLYWRERPDLVLQFRQGMHDEIVYLQMKEEKERKRRKNEEEDKEQREKVKSAPV